MDEAGQSETSESGQAPEQLRRVFISYASRDSVLAQKVCSTLEAAGFPCWIAPRDVVPGTLYADGIVGAIDESPILVLILSKEAVASAHVGRELERATSKRHPIIALRTDTEPLTRAFEYFLNQSQWIEVGTAANDAAIEKLVEAVGQHLSPGSASASTQAFPAPVRKAAMSRRVWGIATAFVVLALVAVYLLGHKVSLHGQGAAAGHATIPVADKSIAVLPFVDMSEKKDQEYFGDGMAEEIIDLLVKVPGLKVIGRTSSFQFKGKTEDLRSIGTQLGVAYVLEGSVRKSGDRLRVTAQLIDSRDGTHLLSQTYNRDLSDVLKVQDEIAIKVARAFQIELVTRDFVSRPALNAEAYTLYLHGMHADERFEPQGWEQAVNDFKRALDLDPTFTEAAGAAAAEYQYGGQVGYVSREVAFEKTRQFAELALKLDPHFVDAHALLGQIYGTYAWDWAAAEKEIKEALDLAPNYPEALWAATVQSLTLGRWDDAVKFALALQEANPLHPDGYFWLSWGQMRRGRLVEAEAAMRRGLELSSTYTFGPYTLALVLLARSQAQPALEEFLKEPSDAARLTGSAMAYFALGRKADSDGALAQSLKLKFIFASGIAAVYAFRGESDEAFKWLDRAYAEKDPLLYGIKFRTEFDKLHDDPRYKAFLKKMNLPE
jgi:TolB-like protein/tetratricopeptide (TPR) repeat protein